MQRLPSSLKFLRRFPSATVTSMFSYIIYLAALSMLAGSAATSQNFSSSGEMNITSCPITYYGQMYEKVYVAFNASRFAVCFKGLYKPGIKNDCILMSGGTADRGGLAVLAREIPTGSGVHRLLPNLKHAGKCVNVIPLKDSQQSEIEQVELGNFGTQAILAIKTYSGYTHVDVEADAQVNGLTVSKQIFQTNETNTGVITDISGCRLSGEVYKTNTTVRYPNICSTVTCDVSGVATAISDCGPLEHCDGNGSCVLNHMCTATGSTVIDFAGRVHSVQDRCGYTLFRSSLIPGFQVLGMFQERRRRDVSFMERVMLELASGVQISLEQGSRVLVNNSLVKLSATAMMVDSVELSKDQSGVTAKISAFNYTASVLFDGSTALIHMKGPRGTHVHGLCGNPSRTLSEEKVSEQSPTGCETQYVDLVDPTINCNATTKWCNLLKQAPFTACNMYIDPEPFIAACTQMLCNYPPVDGLKCQFLEAYIRSCSIHHNITVEGWKSQTGCSAFRQDSCQDRFCSDHEFCGVRSYSGQTGCICRAIFASKYQSTSSFGEPTACAHKAASLTLAKCLLEDKAIDFSVLHLNDEACKGEMDNKTHMVTFNFDSNNPCGTVVMANNSQIIYKNTIMTRNSSTFDMINRHNPVHIDFSCFYSKPDIKNLGFKLKDSSVTQRIASGEWIYNLTMKAYSSPETNEAFQVKDDVQVDQKIWVKLKTEGLDDKMVVAVTDSCWATDQPAETGTLRYDLIINGCPNPADSTVKVEDNGWGTSNSFSFNTFQFIGTNGQVFLHCKVELCVRKGNVCIPRCGQAERRRRSALSKNKDENPALIQLAWTY
uniref:Alpha-tectorin-like n=1 Tax=Scophthalmus maximus TaxID=52904 RepID=A0A8D3ACV9_SCOMX